MLTYAKLKAVQGFSFIELLIALCLLTGSLLVYAQSQLTLFKHNQNLVDLTQAIFQSTSLAEFFMACPSLPESEKTAYKTSTMTSWQQAINKQIPLADNHFSNTANYSTLEITWPFANVEQKIILRMQR